MSRDSSHTHLHFPRSQHAELRDEFSRPALNAPDLQIPAEHQPANPEDEDDVVPDQHAAFGIQRATQGRREVEWRDLGVRELLEREGWGGHGGNGGQGTQGDGTTGNVVRAALEGREGSGRLGANGLGRAGGNGNGVNR